jgi:hypothetical protein
MILEDYLRDKNIARYRRMLEGSTNEQERRIIRKLLAEETAKLVRKGAEGAMSSGDEAG